MTGITLDTGALIALERGSTKMLALSVMARDGRASIAVPVNVIAQAWRGTSRQARVAMLLSAPATEIVSMGFAQARDIGVLCGATGVTDVVDVSVVVCARARGHAIMTSDVGDLRAIDPKIPLELV